MISGVYQILNKTNGKRYIGSATNINKRWGEHWRRLQRGVHSNQHLQNAWDKYGADAFEFGILNYCEPRLLILNEQKFINRHKPKELYNICLVAGSSLGRKFSVETKKRISQAGKGRQHSKKTKEKISQAVRGINNPFYGRHHYEDAKKKISQARTSTHHSEETRKKISQTTKGVNNHFYDKHHSKESKRKIAEACARSFPSFISPTGVIYPTGKNLAAFCRKHKLDAGAMCNVKNERWEHYKGWKLITILS
jgi:group I intron endonuclease